MYPLTQIGQARNHFELLKPDEKWKMKLGSYLKLYSFVKGVKDTAVATKGLLAMGGGGGERERVLRKIIRDVVGGPTVQSTFARERYILFTILISPRRKGTTILTPPPAPYTLSHPIPRLQQYITGQESTLRIY